MDIGQRIDASATGPHCHLSQPHSWAVTSQVLTENLSPATFCVFLPCFMSHLPLEQVVGFSAGHQSWVPEMRHLCLCLLA